MLAIQHAAPWMHNVATNPFQGLIQSRGDAAMFAVVAIVGGGVREEVQRAFILQPVRAAPGRRPGRARGLQPGLRPRPRHPGTRRGGDHGGPRRVLGAGLPETPEHRGAGRQPFGLQRRRDFPLHFLRRVTAAPLRGGRPRPAGIRACRSSSSAPTAGRGAPSSCCSSSRCPPSRHASTRPTRRSTSPISARSGSTATSRSRTSTATSTSTASPARPASSETFLERQTVTGLRENFGTIGCAILWSPFYAVGDLGVRALRAAGRPVEADGFSRPYVAAVCYGSAFYGFLALVLSAAAARDGARADGAAGAPGGATLAVVLAVWLGTPLVFYMYVSPPFSHACSAFAVAAFVLAWLRVREHAGRPAGFVLLGVLAALMTMVREQDAFFAVGPALDFVVDAACERAVRSPDGTDRGARPARCSSAPRPASRRSPSRTCRRRWPTSRSTGASARRRSWRGRCTGRRRTRCRCCSRPSTDCSSGRRWRCVALVGPRRHRGDGRGPPAASRSRARVMFAAQVYISGCVDSWSAAGASGIAASSARRSSSSWACARAGADAGSAAGADRPGRRRGVLCVWWNVALMIQFGTGLMDRQRLEPRPQRAHRVRRRPGAAARAGLALPVRSRQLLRGARRRRAMSRRILCVADVRFPLERANGIQTIETCAALARRGHARAARRPARHGAPAQGPVRVLRRGARRRGCRSNASAWPARPPLRRIAFLLGALGPCAGSRGATTSS